MNRGETEIRRVREPLIEAMARSCMKQGYLATDVEDLLAEAGASEEEFVSLFGNKEGCALAAVDEALTAGISAVSRGWSADRSERESTLFALSLLLRIFAEKPEIGALALTHSRQMLPRSCHERYEAGFAVLTAMMDRMRADDPEEGRVPRCAARAALGAAEAVIRRELAAGRASALPELLPDLIYGAVVPFVGQEEALRLARDSPRLSL